MPNHGDEKLRQRRKPQICFQTSEARDDTQPRIYKRSGTIEDSCTEVEDFENDTEGDDGLYLEYLDEQDIYDFMKSPAHKILSKNNSFVIDSENGGDGDTGELFSKQREDRKLIIGREIDLADRGEIASPLNMVKGYISTEHSPKRGM